MKILIIAISLVVLLTGISDAQKQDQQIAPAKKVLSKHIGAIPDNSTPILKLEELLKTPESYRGKDVVLEGVYGGACGDGDYFFKDKFDMIEFSLDQGTSIEKFKIGTPLRLYGKVKVRMSEKKEAKEENEEKEATVSLEGKGIEY